MGKWKCEQCYLSPLIPAFTVHVATTGYHCEQVNHWFLCFIAELIPELNRRAGFPLDTPLLLFEVSLSAIKHLTLNFLIFGPVFLVVFKSYCYHLKKNQNH